MTFPKNYASVFAACSQDEIRLWSPTSCKELLRVELMQGSEMDFTQSNCVEFTSDGKSIVSGWTDGKVRAFLPQSGRLLWIINNAHKPGDKDYGGVQCLTLTTDCNTMLSGGTDGELK